MATWELSPLQRHASSLVLPDSRRLASVHKDRVVLRDLETLRVLRTWTLQLPATRPATHNDSTSSSSLNLAVSPSAPFLLLVSAPRHRVAFVFHPDQDGVHARLDIGHEGAVAVEWARLGPDGEQVVLCWSTHHLRLSLFRLSDPGNALQILNPKHSHPHGYTFRPDGAFLAVLERHNSRDVIGVYSTSAWALMRYTLHIITPDGRLLSTFSPYATLAPPAPTSSSSSRAPLRKPSAPAAPPAPELSAHDRARQERSTAPFVGLGIRNVKWAPDGEWIAVGGWDGKVRILSRHGWAAIAELGLPTRVLDPVRVWREPVGWTEKTRGNGIVSFEPDSLPQSLTPLAANSAAAVPRMGVAKLEWSPSGRWIAVWDAAHPQLVAIYAFPLSSTLAPSASTRPRLHTLLAHAASPSSTTTSSTSGVRALAWQPPVVRDDEDEDETLVVLAGEKKGFTLWRSTADGVGVAECVGIPARADIPFPVSALSFAADGRSLLLSAPPAPTSAGGSAGEGTFCIAYPVWSDDVSLEDDGAGERTWLAEEDGAGLEGDGGA
ncbi:uncharacterized protein RHOBADRAFT_54651 [Rhodotorula graminis WP1]|uniref:Uncharacterized protein n=1 Tax=Rhodotorula graminis (strain WP1) TaxID=578459 RepID=A0A0P9F2Q3_RHOGW|nr:uncharacterized protein RHOBADRAFT_54651 [Rhodotorula graminis WP1]KPV74090.1 hypothetical protein RHOBADRAFT_54651 [Rhodotorula graminis WP1]